MIIMIKNMLCPVLLCPPVVQFLTDSLGPIGIHDYCREHPVQGTTVMIVLPSRICTIKRQDLTIRCTIGCSIMGGSIVSLDIGVYKRGIVARCCTPSRSIMSLLSRTRNTYESMAEGMAQSMAAGRTLPVHRSNQPRFSSSEQDKTNAISQCKIYATIPTRIHVHN